MKKAVFTLNIRSIDIFYQWEDTTDNATPYSCATGTINVVSQLQQTSRERFKLFEKDHMKSVSIKFTSHYVVIVPTISDKAIWL